MISYGNHHNVYNSYPVYSGLLSPCFLGVRMKNQKVMVVGGAGYIGGSVVDYLLLKRVDILVYDLLVYERDYRKNVNFVYGDVTDYVNLRKVIVEYDPDSIIWLAAIVGDGACAVNPERTIQVNQESVQWLSEHFDGRIIFTSTCSVYGKGEDILNEDSPKNPLSLYASTKLKAENYLYEKDCVIFRLGTLHGVSDEFSRIRMDLVVNILSLKSMLGEPLHVFGGDQWRPLLHVKDAALAISHAAIETDEKPLLNSGVYNIAQQNMTIKDLAERIKEASITDFPVEIVYSDIQFEDQRNYRASISKYENSNSYVRFDRTIEDGALEIMTLIKQHRIKSPYSSNYHNQKFIQEAEKNGGA